MEGEAPANFRLWYGYPPPPPPPSSPLPPPPPPPPQSYPFSDFVPHPSLPLPPGFRPLSYTQSSAFYQAGWWRPPPLVPFHYPPNGFNGAQNPFPYPAAIWSPVAGMPSSVSAPQPPKFIPPGITPSIKTPVRQDVVIHPLQACQWKPRPGRSQDSILVVDNTFSSVEGVGSRKLQNSMSSERIDLESSAVSGDQEIEKQDQKILTQEKEKAKTQTEHTSVSDYACSTSGEGGNLQELIITCEQIEPRAPFIAGEEMQVDETHQAQASPVQTKGKRPKDQMYPLEDGSSTKLQKLSSSSKVGPEASAMPCISLSESHCNFLDEAHTATAEKSHECHDEEVSGSLGSSLFDWATTFGEGEVSSSDLQNEVGSYQVKEKYAVILLAIMKKHGDIGKVFRTSSIMWRSFALEGICEIFQGIRIPLKQLTPRSLEKYTSFVKEAARMGMNVEWLERDLHEISETIDAIKECKVLRDAAEMKKEKFENLENEFGLMEFEKKKLADEIDEIKASLESGAIEIRNKKIAMKDIELKCRNIPKRLVDGLF